MSFANPTNGDENNIDQCMNFATVDYSLQTDRQNISHGTERFENNNYISEQPGPSFSLTNMQGAYTYAYPAIQNQKEDAAAPLYLVPNRSVLNKDGEGTIDAHARFEIAKPIGYIPTENFQLSNISGSEEKSTRTEERSETSGERPKSSEMRSAINEERSATSDEKSARNEKKSTASEGESTKSDENGNEKDMFSSGRKQTSEMAQSEGNTETTKKCNCLISEDSIIQKLKAYSLDIVESINESNRSIANICMTSFDNLEGNIFIIHKYSKLFLIQYFCILDCMTQATMDQKNLFERLFNVMGNRITPRISSMFQELPIRCFAQIDNLEQNLSSSNKNIELLVSSVK